MFTIEEQMTKQILDMDRRIKELEAQNEKFKCCGNCKHWDHESIQKYCVLTEPNFLIKRQLDTCNRWEFAK